MHRAREVCATGKVVLESNSHHGRPRVKVQQGAQGHPDPRSRNAGWQYGLPRASSITQVYSNLQSNLERFGPRRCPVRLACKRSRWPRFCLRVRCIAWRLGRGAEGRDTKSAISCNAPYYRRADTEIEAMSVGNPIQVHLTAHHVAFATIVERW